MFWTLVLAHLIGDYALQTDAVARAKRRWRGLALHVLIHLAAMLVLAGAGSFLVWPQLLVLAAAHFVIDSLKNLNTLRRPRHVILPYVIDQLLHLLSIALVAGWIQALYTFQGPQEWTIYAIAYLLATQVWFISERIVGYADDRYLAEIEAHRWTRMAARALALTVFLFAGSIVWPMVGGPLAGTAAGKAAAAATLAPLVFLAGLVPAPYRQTRYRRRMLLQDLLGPLLLALLALLLSP